MKSARAVIGCCIIVLLVIAIYMKIASLRVHGGFVRGGRWQDNTISANTVLFCASIFLGMYMLVAAIDRKRR